VRIAILIFSSQPVGGAGSYLRLVIPALAERGHHLALWHEFGPAPTGDPFPLPAGSPSWSVEQIGAERAIADLRAWHPHVLFSQGALSDPELETRTLEVAPSVFREVCYQGTCISGRKMFSNPTNTPCSRTFGWPCLVNYYPRRCGGWSPITMVREFRRQSRRLELMSQYKAVVTLSTHMQREYSRHGVAAVAIGAPSEPAVPVTDRAADRSRGDAWRLLFVGRMVDLKGGSYLLDALPRAASALDRPLTITFAGDGPARAAWEASAVRLTTKEPRIHVTFTGWLDSGQIEPLLSTADLLVVPSIWPEPFGLVGLEAARHRLPVAAFAVGGIPDWLHPGINGYLAPGDPPTPAGLADAIVACLEDPDMHARLRDGAARVGAESSMDRHVDALIGVLTAAAGCR
jgi:glycosyltransferase involved in cell wall biosynthesis